MVTEAEARDLLQRAATTIDVPPARDLPTAAPERARWIVPLAAAVAVVVAIAVGVSVSREDRAKEPSPTGPSPALPTVNPGFVPSPFGMRADEATRMLERAGYQVNVIDEVAACRESGRVIDIDPNPTAPLSAGSTVTITVTREAPTVDCVGSVDTFAWQLIDFAMGRGAAPSFADRVLIDINGTTHMLTGEKALELVTRPAQAGGTGLVHFVTRIAGLGGIDPDANGYPIHQFEVKENDGRFLRCGNDPWPEGLQGRSALSVVAAPAYVSGCQTMDVFRTGVDGSSVFGTQGPIDALVYRTGGRLVPFEESAGGSAVNPPENPQAATVAMRFLGFMQGVHKFPDTTHGSIRLYLGNKFQRTIAGDQTDDPAAWDMCATYAESTCPYSPLRLLREGKGLDGVGVVGTVPGCLDTLAEPISPGDVGARNSVVVRRSGPGLTCGESWAVQLFYDDDYRLTAVNVLHGSP